MSVETFLREAVMILVASVAVVLLSRRLRVPTIVGLLATGIVIGPSGLRLVAEVEQVEVFAEIGVIFLLFSIGLELSLARLREVGRAFLLGGSLQTGATIAATAALALALGSSLPRAIFFGFVAALSSTAIVLKLLAERHETESPQGRISLAILLFQDVLIVPMLVMTPVLAGQVDASLATVALRFAAALALVGLVFVLARRLMPWLLDHVVRTRSRELLVLGGLAVCLGLALLTAHVGLSLGLGAFVAGILLSESDYTHQVVADVTPFRDVFTSVFFVSVGMLLDVPFAVAHAPALAGLALGILGGKALLTGATVRVLGFPPRTAILVGLALAQIGEFSFVLTEVGRATGLVDDATYQHVLGAAILTMLLTPSLVGAAPGLAARWNGRRGPTHDAGTTPHEARLTPGHVIVVGYGLAGRSLARVLRSVELPYSVIELNGDVVKRARREGEPILFGDATRRDVLEAAGLSRAAAVVFVVSDLDAVRRSIALVRALAPRAHVVVRTRQQAHIEELTAAGADEVIAEELETAIEILTRVLRHLRIPRNVILAETRLLRGEEYRVLRFAARDPDVGRTLMQLLEAGTTDVFQLLPGSPHAGRTILDLDLRRRTGATLIAVVRGDVPHTSPPPDLVLHEGDLLVLVGSHAQIEAAFTLMESGEG